jgi:hypothetical protein
MHLFANLARQLASRRQHKHGGAVAQISAGRLCDTHESRDLRCYENVESVGVYYCSQVVVQMVRMLS